MSFRIILRTILERAARGLIIKRKLYVKKIPVELVVSPESQLKYLKIGANAFDSDLITIAENYINLNSVVWDIGANVGVFSFASASIAREGTVVAIEPDVWLSSLLQKSLNLKSNRNRDIRICSAAISHTVGISEFMISKRCRAMNALSEAGGRSNMGGHREICYVPTFTLDSLLTSFPKPNFIKIDIEGAELLAIKGASEIISTIRPIFYIEVGGECSQKIFEIFSEQNYVAKSPSGKVLREHCEFNTLFIPR